MPLLLDIGSSCMIHDLCCFLSFCICIIIRLYTTQRHPLSPKPIFGDMTNLVAPCNGGAIAQTLAKIFLKFCQISIPSSLIHAYCDPRFGHYDRRIISIMSTFFLRFHLETLYWFCESLGENLLVRQQVPELGKEDVSNDSSLQPPWQKQKNAY